MKHSSKSLYEHTKKIRDIINNPRKRHVLLKNIALWNQLCSCLDVIEDSDLAIDAYYYKDLCEKGWGKILINLLAATSILRPAVCHKIPLCSLWKCHSRIDDYPRLKYISEIRDDSIGHPTHRDRKKGRPISCSLYFTPDAEPERIPAPFVLLRWAIWVQRYVDSDFIKDREKRRFRNPA